MFASHMDVPSELLVPPEAHGRGFCPHDAALLLDGWLRRLAAQDARGRIVLGRLARAFLRRRGHHDLGFSRLGDYSRERLGISAREHQSLATVSARLERLPQLRAAFADGLLSWAQIRLLTAVATPEDEAEWLARAEGRTVRALAARMRAVLRAMRRIDWQLGRLLRVFLDRRLYRLMEFSSAERYVTERLGLSPRKARALVAVERKTWQADAFGEAYRAGDLSWVRALTLLPVVAESTAAAWVERAGAVPVRRLADEVEWALTVREGLAPIAPPPPGASLALAERPLCTPRP